MKRPAKSGRRSRASQKRLHSIPLASLSKRSQAARDHALHVISAMRREPKLTLTHAAKLQGVKPGTVKKYFPAALKQSHGTYQVTKSDRSVATLYVPDANGNSVPVKTRSSKDRAALSKYLRDLGRYLRGNRKALSHWRGQKIAGVELVTDPHTLAMIEPALSEFSLYRAFNGGTA